MSLTAIIVAWPIYFFLEVVVRYFGFIRSTDSAHRKGKSGKFSLFCLLSPGWVVADYFKTRICDEGGNLIKESRGKFITANNFDNFVISALFLTVPIAIHLHALFVPDIVVGVIFWRFLSRSLEISRAFVDDILNTENKSGLSQARRIKLALVSYAEIYLYSAALYSVLSPTLATLESATLGALFVGTFTNISYVTNCIHEKHLVFIQVFATLSLIVLSIAGYLNNAKKESDQTSENNECDSGWKVIYKSCSKPRR